MDPDVRFRSSRAAVSSRFSLMVTHTCYVTYDRLEVISYYIFPQSAAE